MATPHDVAIELSEADRAVLLSWTRRRKTAQAQAQAQALALRARIVLACADSTTTNTAIAEAMGLSLMTVSKGRRRFAHMALPASTMHPARAFLARSWTNKSRP